MKFLITGSNGFIGKNLKEFLKQRKINFTPFDLPDNDVTSKKSFSGFQGHDVVVHLAAFASIPESFKYPEKTFKINLDGTRNVLDFCRANDSKLIFPSTYPYGRPEYLPVDESHPLQPDSPYKESKVMAEALCEEYSENYGLKISVLRLFNVYGQHQSSNFVIPRIISQLNNEKIELFTSKPRRDFIHVSDVISLFMASLERQKSKFEIFNGGTGKSHSIKEVVDLLLRISNKNPEVVYLGKERAGEPLDIYADITKARTMLEWQPKIKIEEGLKLTLKSCSF